MYEAFICLKQNHKCDRFVSSHQSSYFRNMGGHCGYSVCPSERGKGYAKEMPRLNDLNAKGLGIPKLLITYDVTNITSEKQY